MHPSETYYSPYRPSSSAVNTSTRTQEQLDFQALVAALSLGGHMRQEDMLPPPVRKVRRGWMRMPNTIVGKADDVERTYSETPTPIRNAFDSYAAKRNKGRNNSPPKSTSTSTSNSISIPPLGSTPAPALTSSRKRTSRASNTSTQSSKCSLPLFDDDNECPDTPSTSATSLSSSPDSDSESSSSSDTETSTPKDAMAFMKAVQDSLEVLELYGPDKLAYGLIDRSLTSAKDAELVANIASTLVSEANAIGIPNSDNILPTLVAKLVDNFNQYWNENGKWRQAVADLAQVSPDADYIELNPTNLGVLLGALFRRGIIPAHTIHGILDALVEGRVSYPHLKVMHAIVKHSGAKLCLPDESGTLKSAMFLRKLGRESRHTGVFVWGWNRDAQWLRSDIVLTLQDWAAAEAARMEKEKEKEKKRMEALSSSLKKMDIKSENMKQLNMLGRRAF